MQVTQGVIYPSRLVPDSIFGRASLGALQSRFGQKAPMVHKGFFAEVTGTPAVERNPQHSSQNCSFSCGFTLGGYFFNVCEILRFSDHRGLSSSNIVVKWVGFKGLVIRSESIGASKDFGSRLVVVDAVCCISEKLAVCWLEFVARSRVGPPKLFVVRTWLRDGRDTVQHGEGGSDHSFGGHSDTVRRKYSKLPVTFFWTSHSGKSYMPTCTSVLGFSGTDRDFLGGWCAEGSDKYT